MDATSLFGAELEDAHDREGFRWRAARIGRRIGAERVGCTLYEIEPGQRTWPYHFHYGNEEWLLVVRGAPTLRAPDGERELREGDLVAFPPGPDGAHTVENRTDEAARVAIFSTLVLPSVVEYPDSGKVGIRYGHGDEDVLRFRRADDVDYWDGE